MWLDHQYRFCGAPQPRHPAARGGDRAPGEHPLSGRSGFAGSVSPVSRLSQFRIAPRQSAPAVAGPRSHQRPWRSEGMAAVYPGDGRGSDRSRVVAQRGLVLSGTAVAATTSAVAKLARKMMVHSSVGSVCLQTGKEG